MANRPKPTATKKRQGNPGHRPPNPAEPDWEGKTTCPNWLPTVAKSEWRRLAPHLEREGMLTPATRSAFAGYCLAYAQLVAAAKFLESRSAGGSLKYRNRVSGTLKAWPEVAIAQAASEQMRKYLIEFGLTPAAAAKVPGKGKDPDDAARRFLFGDGDDGQAAAEGGSNVALFPEK
jgi:P27 family predicted phage terminase small subunit